MSDNGLARRRGAGVNLVALEGEVQQALTDFRNAPPEHVVQAAERLSAEAIVREYELASKAIESMGTEIKDRVTKLETAMRDADHDMKLIAEAASAIREKGQHAYAMIEEASVLSKEIRDVIAATRAKAGA